MTITADEVQAETDRLAARHEAPLSGQALEARAKRRRVEVLALAGKGHGFKAIAKMLGVHKRSVQRDFKALLAQGKLRQVPGPCGVRYVVEQEANER